ncbi:hypothetical protein [Lentzea cavernae]|uniref:Uncharacterized protein n=1 Tax=Lentzea cavernae TaxID=2020703 RepID=A0ABQ3MJJ7_9PSEU|nr:hypothetical protein [Lentzea cavernae]GHH44274.1 hypothetical protein GCM10017774_43560 [Lentzea cavernae]
MPGPAHSQDQTARLPVTEARHAVSERDIALQLPEWDLLPPAEFLDRHRRR